MEIQILTFAVRHVPVVDLYGISSESHFIQLRICIHEFLFDVIPCINTFSCTLCTIITAIRSFLYNIKCIINTTYWMMRTKLFDNKKIKRIEKYWRTFPPSTIIILSSKALTYGEKESLNSLRTLLAKVSVPSELIVIWNRNIVKVLKLLTFYKIKRIQLRRT